MLLGNSFACQVIIDLAARYPERVERAVLQGPTTPPDERTWLQQYRRWRENAPFSPPGMDAIASSDYLKCGVVRALKTFEFSLRDRPEDKLRHILAPALVVRGALDPIARQDWVEQVADGLPAGRLVVIPEVAHTLVFTSPVELTAASRPFLDESVLLDQENEPPLTSTLERLSPPSMNRSTVSTASGSGRSCAASSLRTAL
jgi:2-hydroxy-6-oxonona-2,4-dienedioate hydrolase